MEVIHFNSPEERMKYIKGGFEEIILPEVKKEAPKKAKKAKKEEKDGDIKAE